MNRTINYTHDLSKQSSLCQTNSRVSFVFTDTQQRVKVLKIYGYLKLDASYDDSRTTPGNYVKWVDSESEMSGSVHPQKNDGEFNMTANQSRLGMKVNGPDAGTFKMSGLVEVDFYGGSASTMSSPEPRDENKAKLMMRHAYMTFAHPENKLSLLAGQTWDVVAPLNPDTLLYSVLWWSGNIGYRRPQIRITKGIDLGNDTSLELQGAVARALGTGSIIEKPGQSTGITSTPQ